MQHYIKTRIISYRQIWRLYVPLRQFVPIATVRDTICWEIHNLLVAQQLQLMLLQYSYFHIWHIILIIHKMLIKARHMVLSLLTALKDVRGHRVLRVGGARTANIPHPSGCARGASLTPFNRRRVLIKMSASSELNTWWKLAGWHFQEGASRGSFQHGAPRSLPLDNDVTLLFMTVIQCGRPSRPLLSLSMELSNSAPSHIDLFSFKADCQQVVNMSRLTGFQLYTNRIFEISMKYCRLHIAKYNKVGRVLVIVYLFSIR